MTALRNAYITGVGAFLPGKPVSNADMESCLGQVHGRASLLGRRALRWNGIESRHYALGPDGTHHHSGASMCAQAVRAAADSAGEGLGALDLLATATTQGDLLVPGHGVQVQAELGVGPLEVASFQSVCASALMAAKTAWLNVRTGEAENAVAAASEFSSRWFRPEFYDGSDLIDAKGRLPMQADFLRWTLSDGAGAIWMQPAPARAGISLRVDWIDMVSLAHQYDPCMWAGGAPGDQHDLSQSWSASGPQAAFKTGAIALMQDFTLLKTIIRAWIGEYLKKVDSGRIVPAEIDRLLLHYSAKSLREEIIGLLESTGGMIDEARWFNNLKTKGNTGSASIWIMLEDLFARGDIVPGTRILCIVPESGRAMVGFMHVTAVGPDDGDAS